MSKRLAGMPVTFLLIVTNADRECLLQLSGMTASILYTVPIPTYRQLFWRYEHQSSQFVVKVITWYRGRHVGAVDFVEWISSEFLTWHMWYCEVALIIFPMTSWQHFHSGEAASVTAGMLGLVRYSKIEYKKKSTFQKEGEKGMWQERTGDTQKMDNPVTRTRKETWEHWQKTHLRQTRETECWSNQTT